MRFGLADACPRRWMRSARCTGDPRADPPDRVQDYVQAPPPVPLPGPPRLSRL